jgi:transcriptional regulator NrdR family protein
MFKVQKKDGRLEDFDRNKIISGLVKSGTTPPEAEDITSQVEAWLPTVAVGGTVKTLDIREKVLELLRLADPTAADNFENYQKPVTV